MPTLILRCLGPLEIRLGEMPLGRFQTRKARALLVYLACHAGQEFSREHLQTLLWSESPPHLAARSLRQALIHLRHILPPDFLLSTRTSITFNSRSDYDLDVERFARDPLDVALYRGDFLKGFDVPDAQAWEEWLQAQREELQARALGALETLGARRAARGEYPAAADCYHRALTIDLWRESAHQALMRMYALAGDRAAAIAQYEKSRAALAQGLDLETLPETDALYRRILEGTVEPLKEVEAPVPLLPFVGRGDAYARLFAAWQESKQRGAILTLVEGEAGLGKTRLVEEVLRQIEMQGALVARGQCVEYAEKVPYRPMVEALRALWCAGAGLTPPRLPRSLSPVWLAELARLLPELREHYPDLPAAPAGESDRHRLFDAVAQWLETFAQSDPRRAHAQIVFFLDDLQWCDAASLDLVHHLIHSFKRQPNPRVYFIGTYRPEETPADHALTRLYLSLSRDALAARVLLMPLSNESIAEIARALSDDPALAELLLRESNGSPFIAEELVKGLDDAGRIQSAPFGKWVVCGDLADALPREPGENITLQRINRLPAEARWLLNIAAVLGEPFRALVLADIAGTRAAALAESIELWQARRLVLADVGGAYDFAHDKIREKVYQQLAPELRQLLHERVGQGLLDHATRQGLAAEQLPGNLASQVAYHFEKSFDPRRARPFLAQAAEGACRVYAYAAAIGYYQRLLPFLAGSEKLDARIRLGDLYHLEGNWKDAARALEQAIALAQQMGDARGESRAWNELSYVQANQGKYRAQLESMARAEQAARGAGESAQGELAETLGRQGWAHYRLGNLQTAQELGARALAMADAVGAEGTPEVETSLRLLGGIYLLRGEFDLARNHFERMRAAHHARGEARPEAVALSMLGEVARLRGDFAAAVELYQSGYDLARQVNDQPGMISLQSNLGGALVGTRNYSAAEPHLRQVLAMKEAANWAGLSETHRFLAEVCLAQGAPAEALEHARRALEIAQSVEQRDMLAGAWRMMGVALSARSQTLVLAKREWDARACFGESLRVCEETGMPGERAWTLRAWGESERARGDAPAAHPRWAHAQRMFERLGMMWDSREMFAR